MGRIIVLQEDSNLRELLCLILAAQAHQVSAATSLFDALLSARRGACDLLLIDLPVIVLDDLDPGSRSMLQEIGQRVSTIVCTAWNWATEIDARQLHAVDVIAAPFDLEDLLARVERALGKQPVAV